MIVPDEKLCVRATMRDTIMRDTIMWDRIMRDRTMWDRTMWDTMLRRIHELLLDVMNLIKSRSNRGEKVAMTGSTTGTRPEYKTSYGY